MPSRTVFTFVAEPSLEKKDLKSKDLILSTALTHISRFRYDQSIPRKQSKKSQNKKRGSKHLRDLCKAHHGCCCSSTPSRVPTKVTIKGVIENQVYATIPMQPLISPYLNETYRDKSQARITRLCEFYFSFIGALYVWRSFGDEEEARAQRGHMVQMFLQIPAMTEAVLAIVQYFDNVHNADSVELMCPTVLFHQRKALELFRQLLDEPAAAVERYTVWIIIGHMALNGETGDWASFEANLRGLKTIVALRGGMDNLRSQDPRAFYCVQQVEIMYRERKSATKEFVPETALPLVNLTVGESMDEEEEPMKSPPSTLTTFASGLATLRTAKKLGTRMGTLLQRGIVWLELEGNSISLIGQNIQQELSTALATTALTEAELFLGTAVLVLLTTEHAGLDAHAERAQDWLSGSNRLLISRVVQARSATVNQRRGTQLEFLVEPYVLWTAFVFAAVPLNTTVYWADLHQYLLRDCLARASAALSRWEYVSSVFNDFYANKAMHSRFKNLWRRGLDEMRHNGNSDG